MTLTSAQIHALAYIYRRRRIGPRIGPKLSPYMLNKLKRLGLVMEYDGIILLTVEGQCELAKTGLNKAQKV